MVFPDTIKFKLPLNIVTRQHSLRIREHLCGWHVIWTKKCTTHPLNNSKAFEDYLDDFMKLFLDDFVFFSDLDTHLSKLQKCFDKCWEYGISLNSKKCAFMVFLGMILCFIVSKEGKLLDPTKKKCLVQKTLMISKSLMAWPNSIDVLWKTLHSLWQPSQK
jgi:hypothetical protein